VLVRNAFRSVAYLALAVLVLVGFGDGAGPVATPLRADEQARTPRQAAEATVVMIVAAGCGGVTIGSGVLVDGDRVLTNRHVVTGASSIEIRQGAVRTGARVERVGADLDLAVLWVGSGPGNASPGAASAPAGQLQPGAHVWVAGHPRGGALTVTEGPVNARVQVDTPGMRAETAWADAVAEPGNSGGGAFDISGRLVGIVYGREDHTGLVGIIDGDQAAAFLEGAGASGNPSACPD
jgi:S1-C subfamily serine protease